MDAIINPRSRNQYSRVPDASTRDWTLSSGNSGSTRLRTILETWTGQDREGTWEDLLLMHAGTWKGIWMFSAPDIRFTIPLMGVMR